jgi:glycosyltransferase involved in cell wall biosynthesis
MKIAMAVSFSLGEISGTPIHARTIARLLRQNGDEIFVVATENRLSPKIIKDCLDGITVYRLPLWLSPLLVVALLARKRPQVISVQAQGALAAMALPAALLGIPLVYEVHGLFRDEMTYANGNQTPWRARFYALIERLALPLVRRVIVLSEKVRQVYVQELNIPASRVCLLYPAVHFAHFQALKDLPEVQALKAQCRDRLVIMYAGSLHQAQGVGLLVEAMCRVLTEVTRVKLVIIGDKPETEYVRLLDKVAPFQEQVIILGYRPHEDIPSYLSVADILVIPRPDIPLNRVSPRKMCEYMAAGKPVVATDVADFRQIFPRYGAGLVTDCTPDGLAEGLLRLLRDAALRRRLGNNGRNAARQHFDFDAVIHRYREIYQESCSKPALNLRPWKILPRQSVGAAQAFHAES